MNTILSKLLAGTAGFGLAATLALAGPGSGVSIWRNDPTPAGSPTATPPALPTVCTDARLISVKEAKWVRGGGRGMTIVDAGKRLVCNSCATPVAITRPVDRNGNGPKANLPSRGLHDCTSTGCGGVKTAPTE